jgi:RNA polymerase sigma-70 factor (ECF subfamily)
VEAHETAVEALEVVWRRAGLYRPERGAALAWILTVARNRARDRLRARRRSASRDQALDEVADRPSSAGDADRGLFRLQWAVPLRWALGALLSVQRRTLVASFLLGFSHREIARLTRQPVGTVKGRIRISLAKLRAILRDRVEAGG